MAKLILNVTSSSRQEIALHRTPLSIGRDPSNDIVLADRMASRRHAVIERRGGRYYLRDCNSLNGSTVNGGRLAARCLRNGDLVTIGATRLVYWEGPPAGDSVAALVPHPSAVPPQCPNCGADRSTGDRLCQECGSELAPAAGPSETVCDFCGTAVILPARFCIACGSRLARQEKGLGLEPALASGESSPASGAPVTQITQWSGGIPGQLTAQQASLIRAVVLNRADYLQRSCYRDPTTGQRIAYSLEEDEWSRFVAIWSREPIACIGAVNRAIAELRSPDRIRRYLEAAVELETLMDRGTMRAPEARVFSGIPAYIMDGYTDLGRNPSRTVRRGREKLRVDKQRLKPWLVETRWRALAYELSLEELLAGFYDVVRRSLGFDESRVNDLSSEWNDRTLNLSRFLDDGVGVCRHQSILYQLCLQEAAIPGRVVKGSLYVYGLEGRHAWNVAWLGGRVALIDVTLPSRKGPLIVVGASQEEVYRVANRGERRYIPTPDQQNHYKIGAPVDGGLGADAPGLSHFPRSGRPDGPSVQPVREQR